MSNVKTVKCYGRDWLANPRKHGAGGAQEKLLEDLKPEPWVYLRIHIKEGYRYGGMSADDLLRFLTVNRHTYEIIATDRKRKFYLDYDHYMDNTDQSAEVHDAALAELQAKACTDAESVCGPGRAVLSGSWGLVDGNKVKYSVHLVRPDRYFANHAASLPMVGIVKSFGADHEVYIRNQLLKLPNQSKRNDPRVQKILTGELKDHVVTAFFDDDATEMILELPPPAPGAVRRRTAAARVVKVPLAPWPDQEAPIPDDWAMSSPALETLRLIRHSAEPAHKLPRNTRYMLMGWCRHRGVSLDDFLEWVWQGKEDTPERRARYS